MAVLCFTVGRRCVVFYCGSVLCCVLPCYAETRCGLSRRKKVATPLLETGSEKPVSLWVGLQAARPNSCPLEAKQQNTNYATAD